MEASREDQRRLLELQEVDTRLAQLRAAQKKHPARAAIDELNARRSDLDRAHVTARSHASDTKRELRRVEADLERLVARQEMMGKRLESGEGSPKDLQAIQYEMNQMAERRDVLETEILTFMGSLDEANESVEAIRGQLEAISADEARLRGELGEALGELGEELSEKEAKRAELAGQIASDLLDEYEYCRSRSGGLGVLEAQGRQIKGMVTQLSQSEWHEIASLGPDEVYQSEELECLVVKTS